MRPLLTGRQRTLHPRAQVATLARIGRRAASKADWLEELGRQGQPVDRAEVDRWRDRASQAVDEIAGIVRAHPVGFTAEQRRAVAR